MNIYTHTDKQHTNVSNNGTRIQSIGNRQSQPHKEGPQTLTANVGEGAARWRRGPGCSARETAPPASAHGGGARRPAPPSVRQPTLLPRARPGVAVAGERRKRRCPIIRRAVLADPESHSPPRSSPFAITPLMGCAHHTRKRISIQAIAGIAGHTHTQQKKSKIKNQNQTWDCRRDAAFSESFVRFWASNNSASKFSFWESGERVEWKMRCAPHQQHKYHQLSLPFALAISIVDAL